MTMKSLFPIVTAELPAIARSLPSTTVLTQRALSQET